MKLQLALDKDLKSALDVLQEARPFIDIAELGTPLLIREGMNAVHAVRRTFPDLPLLADLKIIDAGEEEAAIAFEAGCDMVTVLGLAHDATIRGAVLSAAHYGGQIMADLIHVADVVGRGRELLAMGCRYLCVHTAHDAQVAPLIPLARLRDALPDAPLAVAGGIKPEMMEAVAAYKPNILIVGSAITAANNPAVVARAICDRMEPL